MKNTLSKFFTVTSLTAIVLFSSLYATETPTEKYLKTTPLETIAQSLKPEEEARLPTLLEISAKESENGFFGYHGSTQNFRIFQDIIRAVLEQKFEFVLPQDFYFFRIPGKPQYHFPNGLKDFKNEITKKNNDKKVIKLIIQTFLLEPLQSEMGVKIKFEQFTKSDIALLSESFEDIASQLSEKRALVEKTPNSEEQATATDTQNAPAEKAYRIIFKILAAKKGSTPPTDLQPWIEQQLSTHGILKTYFNVADEKKKNLMTNFFYPFWDVSIGQREFLISLNIPLFGNYAWPDEGSLGIVLNNATLEGGDKLTIKFLQEWFRQIGLPQDSVIELVNIGRSHVPETSQGVLFQFFDIGSEPYQFTEKHAYVSYPYGVEAKGFTPSEVLTGTKDIDYHSGNSILQRQIRLLMSNEATLNPYSNLRIIRYDFLGETVANQIVSEMKDTLLNTKVNQKKLNAYKSKLEKSWEKS